MFDLAIDGKLRADEKRIAAQITEAVEPLRVPADEELPSVEARAAEIETDQPGTGDRPGTTDRPDAAEQPGAESARLGYAISDYPDVEDVMRRLRALTAQPVRGLRHDAMLDVLAHFETKCRASREITDRAKT